MSQQTLGIANAGKVIDLPTKVTTQPTFTFLNTSGVETITDLTFTALEDDIDASLDMTNVVVDATILIKEFGTPAQIKQWVYPTDNDSINDKVMKIGIIGHGLDVIVTIEPVSDLQGITIPMGIATYSY